MLLSDELLEIGRKANPKNNLSMAQAGEKILERITQAGLPVAKENVTLKYVFSTLNKEGFSYFGEVIEYVQKARNELKSK